MKIKILIFLRVSICVIALLSNTIVLAESITIMGATIIDGNGGRPIKNGTIVITDGRITAVGKKTDVSVPSATKKIDARGKYVIPGLMDANVHLLLEISIETLSRYEGRYEDLITEAAQITLKNGVTTVFDSWGPRQPLVNVRDNINAGKVIGSRFFLAGNIVGFDGPFSIDFSMKTQDFITKGFADRVNEMWEQGVGANLLWMPPEQVREKVRAYVGKDIDFLKYAASGHAAVQEQFITFSQITQRAIVEEAHRAGMIAQSHTTSVDSLRLAIEAGVDLLQHCDLSGPVPIPKSIIQIIAEREIPCSTLSRTDKRQRSLKGTTYKSNDLNTRNMIEAGVTFLLSTDGGVLSADAKSKWVAAPEQQEDLLMILGEGHFNWLKAMDQKGLNPMENLLAATRNIARAYKVDKDLGTLEKGKIADLLILDKNPLKNVENYRNIHLVMKEGKVVDRTILPLKPILTKVK